MPCPYIMYICFNVLTVHHKSTVVLFTVRRSPSKMHKLNNISQFSHVDDKLNLQCRIINLNKFFKLNKVSYVIK